VSKVATKKTTKASQRKSRPVRKSVIIKAK